MHTVETVPAAPEKTEKTAERAVLRPPVASAQHRIYVWSSPSPYAVVVDERRSWQPR